MQQEAGDRKGDGKHVTHILFLNYNLVCSAMFFPSLKQIQSTETTFYHIDKYTTPIFP